MFALRRVSVTVMVIDSIIPLRLPFSQDSTVAELNGLSPAFAAGVVICANFCLYVQ